VEDLLQRLALGVGGGRGGGGEGFEGRGLRLGGGRGGRHGRLERGRGLGEHALDVGGGRRGLLGGVAGGLLGGLLGGADGAAGEVAGAVGGGEGGLVGVVEAVQPLLHLVGQGALGVLLGEQGGQGARPPGAVLVEQLDLGGDLVEDGAAAGADDAASGDDVRDDAAGLEGARCACLVGCGVEAGAGYGGVGGVEDLEAGEEVGQL